MIPTDTAITGAHDRAGELGHGAAWPNVPRASIDDPVTVNGQPVIPRGADVLTKLVDDEVGQADRTYQC